MVFFIFVEQHAFCWIQTALIIIIIFGHFSFEALSAHFINNKKTDCFIFENFYNWKYDVIAKIRIINQSFDAMCKSTKNFITSEMIGRKFIL